MSDFDNFDDLDAVRDFRAGVGLMTPAADDRIRRRIIDLAIARGLADGTRYVDPTTIADDEAEPSIVFDLPVEGDDPHVPAASTGTGSSDGSAAVVELHTAARPPARPPRVLVAAAAILVVLIAATALFVTRRNGGPADVDVAIPPSSATTVAPSTTTTPIATYDALKVALRAKRQERLLGNTVLKTVDTITTPVIEAAGQEPGTQTYELTQERGRDNRFRVFQASGGTFVSAVNGTPTSSVPELNQPIRPFAGFTYEDVEKLGVGATADALRQRLLDTEGATQLNYAVVNKGLELVRNPLVPSATRAALLDVVAGATPTTRAEGEQFVLTVPLGGDERVEVTFASASGDVLGWVHLVGVQATDRLRVDQQPVVVA